MSKGLLTMFSIVIMLAFFSLALIGAGVVLLAYRLYRYYHPKHPTPLPPEYHYLVLMDGRHMGDHEN